MKKFKVQAVDGAGNITSDALNDDVLLEERARRSEELDKVEFSGERDEEDGPYVPMCERAVGTVIILAKDKEPKAEYVTEVYPGKAGAEPWKGAGTGFYAGGNYYRTSDEGRSWRSLRLKAGQPVEVAGKDVRTLPLPNVAPAQAEAMSEPPPEVYEGAAGCGATAPGAGKMLKELADGVARVAAKSRGCDSSDLPEPTKRPLQEGGLDLGENTMLDAEYRKRLEHLQAVVKAEKLGDLPTGQIAVPGLQEPKKPEPRPTLDVAIERYQNLDEGVQRFLVRLDSWVVTGITEKQGEFWQGVHDSIVGDLLSQWTELGMHLANLAKEGLTVKVTNRSRRDAWMRPGAEVSLREDVERRFGAVYTADVLENLVIRAATENDVFLVSGDRELGLVPKAQIRKRAHIGKSDASTAK